jgi:hypothetical protein
MSALRVKADIVRRGVQRTAALIGHFYLILLLLLVVSQGAIAQPTEQEKHETAVKLSAEITRAIKKRDDGELQQKTVRRMAECAFIYSMTSNQDMDANSKYDAALAAEISREILARISIGLSADLFTKIVSEANKSLIDMSKRQDTEWLFRLLKNCKLFHDPNQIDDAVAELTF